MTMNAIQTRARRENHTARYLIVRAALRLATLAAMAAATIAGGWILLAAFAALA